MLYIFDIDGTLTEPRKKITEDMLSLFSKFITKKKEVILVTGSDAPKTIEQIGYDLWSKSIVFQCAGNVLYANGILIYGKEWTDIPGDMTLYLKQLAKESDFPWRFPKIIEERTGMINFSPVGRDCPQEIRKEYFEWDKINQQREKFVELIKKKYKKHNIEVRIGGEISIDIYPKGYGKEQVVRLLQSNTEPYRIMTFVGDKISDGNDKDIADLVLKSHGYVVEVAGPSDTKLFLEKELNK